VRPRARLYRDLRPASASSVERYAARRRRAFTLVELVTAASLMTLIMVGIVQIFATVTQTASDAEGLVFAQQQARAFFDRLHTELRGMTREGYLRIMHNSVRMDPTTGIGTIAPVFSPTGTNAERFYAADSLAFVTLGSYSLTLPPPNTPSATPKNPSIAEVLYSSNVQTHRSILKLESTNPPISPIQLTPRRGLLARGQWLFNPDAASGTAADLNDYGKPMFLCDLFASQPSQTSAIKIMPPSPQDRMSQSGATDGHVQVMPWIALTGKSDKPETMKRVLSSCVSEFYVEVFDPGAENGSYWGESLYAFTSGPYTYNPSSGTTQTRWDIPFYWSSSSFPASTPNNTACNIKTWPTALRVTIAIHDPGDTKPPEIDTATGRTQTRFKGYAFQEIFWIADP